MSGIVRKSEKEERNAKQDELIARDEDKQSTQRRFSIRTGEAVGLSVGVSVGLSVGEVVL